MDAARRIKEEEDLFKQAWTKWGSIPQMMMLVEECSELQKAVLKALRKLDYISSDISKDAEIEASIVEEIADVQIMIDQLVLILKLKDKVMIARESKINRLQMRLRRSE
jgi:hypothetical protein